ncbi:MAG TPA: hypothetical protein VMK16_10675 [Acidimicrobiales bacterium]|nr:hypothetical protein [Acidimicrobiales bacterium]
MARNLPRHVVVDGSNIATEGRSHPSLKQLDEAVRAFMAENPDHTVTVVVDATFGHRIDKGEVAAFDTAIDENELVSPPAGAIGRGDAFVLQIADKADALVLSNDSFQEFHGEYEWLFDEGRLMGGKPVPHVGWVFVLRSPVRGPTSRRAVRTAKKVERAPAKKSAGRPSAAASAPMPVPKTPPPSKRKAAEPAAAAKPAAAVDQKRKPADALNPLLPFVEFVAHHPVGSSIDATVESFSSHGAYATAESVRCYIPLRYLGKPAPRSAREVLTLGATLPFTVVSIAAGRRGVDLALPGFEPDGVVKPDAVAVGKKAAPKKAAPKKAAAKKGAAKKAAAKKESAPKELAAKEAPARHAPVKKAAVPKKAVAKKAAAPSAKKVAAPKKAAAKKAAAPSA